jgi:hypothetical protein
MERKWAIGEDGTCNQAIEALSAFSYSGEYFVEVFLICNINLVVVE